MNTCCPHHLEALSALVDGEVTPEESQHLQQHLAECTGCRAAFEAMQGLGSDLTALPTQLNRRFASTVAEYVRANHGLPGGPPGRHKPWRLVADLRKLWSHPLRQLVAPARRRRLQLGPRDILKIVALFGLPALAMSLLRDAAPLATFLTVAGVGLLLGIPARHMMAEVSVLGSLRRGRCLDEILTTGLSASSVVDTLATQGLGELLKASLPIVPILLLGSLALSPELRSPALWTATLWLPAAAGLFLVGSYICQFFLAWSGVGMAATLLSGVAFWPVGLFLSMEHKFQGSNGNWLGWLGWLSLAAVWVACTCRYLTVWALEHPNRVEEWTRRGLMRSDTRRNHWLSTFSDNPITRRELARVAGSVPQGVKGLFLWRLSMVVVPLVWGVWATTQGDHWSRTFWSGLALFSVAIFARSATRTLPAIVHERERGSWEMLLGTRLGLNTFVRGWLEVSFYTVFIESIFGIFVLLLFGLMAPGWIVSSDAADGLRVASLAGLTMAGACLVGAVVGLSLSATCTTHREAGSRLLSLLTQCAVAWLLLWGAGFCLCLLGTVDTRYGSWGDLVQHDLPLASAVAIGLVLWLRATSALRRHFGDLEKAASDPVAAKHRYPATVLPLELSGLGFLSYFTALVVFLQNGFVSGQDYQPGQISFGLLMLGALWVVLVRLPLATLAELCLGRFLSLGVGLVYGLLAGVSVPLLLATLECMMQNRIVVRSAGWFSLPEISPELVGWCIVAGGVLGLVLGEVARRAAAPGPERTRLLRSRLLSYGGLSVLILGSLGLWVGHAFSQAPEAPAETRAILERSRKRCSDSHAVPRADNGFEVLRPQLLGVQPPDAGWRSLSEFFQYESRDEFVSKINGSKGKRGRELFLALLPQLDLSLSRPQFVFPLELDLAARTPNFIWLRHVAQSLAVQGRWLETEGRWDEALGMYVRGLSLGDRTTGQGALIHEMMAVAVQAIAVHRVLALETNHPLSPEQYRRLITQVEQSRMRPENLALCLEFEMGLAWTFLERSAAERSRIDGRAGLPLPAFYLRHEQAALATVYVNWIPAAREMRLTRMGSLNPVEALQAFPVAPIARELVPNINRAALQFASALTRQEAVRTVAALHLYHLDHQAWPTDLDQLVGPYLSTSPRCYNTADRKFTYEVRQGQATLSARGMVSRNRDQSTSRRLFPYDEAER